MIEKKEGIESAEFGFTAIVSDKAIITADGDA